MTTPKLSSAPSTEQVSKGNIPETLANQWQPIETMPKQGAFLVLKGSDIGIGLVKPWSLHDVQGITEGAAWVGQKPYETGMSLWLGGNDPSDATHWMSLPAPPSQA